MQPVVWAAWVEWAVWTCKGPTEDALRFQWLLQPDEKAGATRPFLLSGAQLFHKAGGT